MAACQGSQMAYHIAIRGAFMNADAITLQKGYRMYITVDICNAIYRAVVIAVLMPY